MQAAEARPRQYQLQCPKMPLAVYREVAAHLRQVEGVDTELLPQTSQTFDYLQSQVGGIRIRHAAVTDEAAYHQVEQILAYYGDRYQGWEPIDD
ncbi:MAG: hypothetical protein F6K19_22250 [Cyanothece sp. SIO1E1]|nr:hypothetical protein [Cyanothece sp. SIO1E1]